jgi:hypothetical protein
MAKVVVALVVALGATGSEGRKLGSALKFGRTPEDVVAAECVDERCVLQSCCFPHCNMRWSACLACMHMGSLADIKDNGVWLYARVGSVANR